jgi:diadenylate cyclase
VEDILWTFSHIQLLDVIDILLVAATIYALFFFMQGTQAIQLLRGMILVVLVMFLLSRVLRLSAFRWLIEATLPALVIGIPVIFQPELRRALERLGRTGQLFVRPAQDEVVVRVIDAVARAVHRLSAQRHGALIVLERETGLQEYVETGVPVNGEVSSQLLRTIFYPSTALHDKAIIIRNERVVAAGCMLPASTNPQYAYLGTRHRAAVGITEASDALVVVVSEETGTISVAYNGRLVRHLNTSQLRAVLTAFFQHRLSGDWTRALERSASGGASADWPSQAPPEAQRSTSRATAREADRSPPPVGPT